MSYIVIRWPCDREHLPTTTHATQLEAVLEAERLAKKHPNAVFRVAEFKAESRSNVQVFTSVFIPCSGAVDCK